jgi:hypothetical protein
MIRQQLGWQKNYSFQGKAKTVEEENGWKQDFFFPNVKVAPGRRKY